MPPRISLTAPSVSSATTTSAERMIASGEGDVAAWRLPVGSGAVVSAAGALETSGLEPGAARLTDASARPTTLFPWVRATGAGRRRRWGVVGCGSGCGRWCSTVFPAIGRVEGLAVLDALGGVAACGVARDVLGVVVVCVVVGGGVAWCVVVGGGVAWCVVVGGGVAWCVVVGGGVAWCVVVGGGVARCVVVGGGVARCVVVGGGSWSPWWSFSSFSWGSFWSA